MKLYTEKRIVMQTEDKDKLNSSWQMHTFLSRDFIGVDFY